MSKEPIVNKVIEFLSRNKLFGKTFVLGFSGGYDSMCLLNILSSLDVNLIVAHFNHGWRKEADIEEEHCKSFCDNLDVKFVSERARADLKKTETDARNARYKFFERIVKEYNADGIFTAHNMDDNAETVIYRIIKGTGITGLRGIQEIRENIYRPLLNCTRSEIEKYCAENGLNPNIDKSNFDVKYKRNFIRHQILPQMSEINKDVKQALCRLSELANMDELIIEEYLSNIKSKIVKNNIINTQEFLELNIPVQQRLLYSLLSECLEEYDFKRVKEIHDFILINATSLNAIKMSLTNNLWLSVNSTEIAIYEDNFTKNDIVEILKEGEYHFAGGVILIERCETPVKNFPKDEEGIAYVDFSKIEFPIELRYGTSNDNIKPFGMNGRMDLKKYLSGKKISERLRNRITVLAKNENIIWIPLLGLSDDIKVVNKVTHRIIWKETT